MDESLIKLGLRSQTVPGGIQLILVAIFGTTLIAFLKSTYNRDSFTCVPETNSITKQLCYDEYTSALSQWLTPLYFVVLAYVVLVVFSISFLLYGAFTLRQIKRDRQNKNNRSKKPDSFKSVYLLHVCCRLIFIGVMIGIFCGNQTLIVPRTYKCSLAAVTTPIPFNQTELDLHCHDQHYREKSISNIAIIAIKVFIMILCIIEFIQVKRLTPPQKLLTKLLGEIFDDESIPLGDVSGQEEDKGKPEDEPPFVPRPASPVRRPPSTAPTGKDLWEALKYDPVDKQRVRRLLKYGAPANFREPGTTGRTPLHFVLSERNGDDELMETLLQYGANTNLGDSYDLTPLHLAAEKGNLEAVKKLINYGADRSKRSRAGETPAEVAERKQHESVVNYLTSA